MNNLNFLGTSGQNIKDILLNSERDIDNSDEGQICLDKIKNTLEYRHICPTAPDTLRIFPFKDSDPFIISQNDELDLSDTK